MTIQTVSMAGIAAPAKTSSRSAEKQGALGQDEFLKLLITQLKNQDPLNPLESVDFTAQLAQFSSLEQLFKVSDHLDAIKTSLLLQEGDQLVQYLGKSVKSAGNILAVQDGAISPASFRLKADGEVRVSIYSADGSLVRNLEMGRRKAGDHPVSWDGKDGDGKPVAEGNYLFEVEGVDMNGQPVACQTYVAGEVTGVRHESGKSFLLVGERQLLPDSIVEINQP